MFHISNTDDVKSEWNINETHIIIPMIDGDVINKESDKILTSSLTLNPLEAGDQAMLSNALEHSFVIGLDKNLFETPNYKSDLVIIQNSDLKLLPCNNDLKNPVAYALSYVDQDKNEILWHKDRIYTSDKAILEVRDELDYQDSVLEKTEQINLVNIDSDIISKADDEILHEEIINEEKNDKSQFINYLTVAQNTTVPNLQYLDSSKLSESCLSIDINKVVECNFHSKSDSLDKVRNRLEETLFHDVQSVTESEPNNIVEYAKHKTEEKEAVVGNENIDEKVEGGESYKGVSDSLPEKSLPLKKKAKMKRTLPTYSSEIQRLCLKQGVTALNQQMGTKALAGRKTKQLLLTNKSSKEESQSCDPVLSQKAVKHRKATNLKSSSKKSKKHIPVVNESTTQKFKEEEASKIQYFGFDKNKFSSIYDLVECLRKCKMINASIWQTLNSGLKEMNVDILKEMNAKKNEKQSSENTNYSPQLKAFALVLYFKQPAAFNYLSQVYKAGWPSLKIIKDWKRQINSHQRPSVSGVEKSAEHLKS